MEVIQEREENGYSDGKVHTSGIVGQNLEQYNFILMQIGGGMIFWDFVDIVLLFLFSQRTRMGKELWKV